MDNEKLLEKYGTIYQKKIVNRFAEEITDDEKEYSNYENKMDFLWALAAPEQYKKEDEMMEYLKKHPKVTIKELNDYFDKITPDGLPPGEKAI